MAMIVGISSDIFGGVLTLLLTAVHWVFYYFVYPRLIGKSLLDSMGSGKTIEVSTRSINKVHNWFGFFTVSLTILVGLVAFTLEFGVLGFTESLCSVLPSVILGGGRRFGYGNGSLFLDGDYPLPYLFDAAIGSCITTEPTSDYYMIKNQYPAIFVNTSESSIESFDVFECTSSWIGSAEWSIDPAGSLDIPMDSVTEQFRYEDVYWGYNPSAARVMASKYLTISYGSGTSFRGEDSPVVIVNTTSDVVTAVSISEEDGYYVYSLSNSMEYSEDGDSLSGQFLRGHYRSSEYSTSGIVSILLIAELWDSDYSFSDVYFYSNVWFQSEITSGTSLIYNNPQGSEKDWPDLSYNGVTYKESEKSTQPELYPFSNGTRDSTLIRSWFIPLACILVSLVVSLSVASIIVGKKKGFWTYDGLSCAMRDSENPTVCSVISRIGSGDSGQIRLVRDDFSQHLPGRFSGYLAQVIADRMVFTLGVSSDIASGLAGVAIAIALYTLTSLAYPRLMSKSTEKHLGAGKAVRLSTRSMNSVRNHLGFWTLFLTMLAHLIALTLEFGLLGVTVPVYSEQAALILGGGRRFSSDNSSELFSTDGPVPHVFGAAIRSCISFEVSADYKMVKNGLPAIGTGANESATSIDRYDVFECTSSWLGSAEWTIDPAGNLTIDMDTVNEQYRYEDVSWVNDFGGGVASLYSENLTIYYGLGQSYRGEVSRVIIFDKFGLRGLGAESAAISVSVEEEHYVYSVSTELTDSTIGGETFLEGPFRRGHFRFSEFSLGAIVSMLLVSGACDTMSQCYTSSESFWETQSTDDFLFLVLSNPAGSEESWPTLPGLNGEVFSEYEKPISPQDYPFKSSEREVTIVRSWFVALASIFGFVVLTLNIISFFIGSSSGFSTYDGLSKIAAGGRSGFPVVRLFSSNGKKYVGFVSREEDIETN